MTALSILASDFHDALNGELSALGCGLRVATTRPSACRTMLVVTADDRMLGSLPDHTDAPTIAAFEQIICALDPTIVGARPIAGREHH